MSVAEIKSAFNDDNSSADDDKSGSELFLPKPKEGLIEKVRESLEKKNKKSMFSTEVQLIQKPLNNSLDQKNPYDESI